MRSVDEVKTKLVRIQALKSRAFSENNEERYVSYCKTEKLIIWILDKDYKGKYYKKKYARHCKRCNQFYRANSRLSKICPNCNRHGERKKDKK